MKRRLSLAVAAVVGLAVLTGCNIGAKVVVNPNGSGTYSVILTTPKSTTGTTNALYVSMQRAASKSAVPLTVARTSQGGEQGASSTFTFKSLADLKAESAAVAKQTGGLGVTIVRTHSGWSFSAAPAPTAATSNAGGDTGGPISASALEGLATVSVEVQLPGRPAETNANGVTRHGDTSTFTWRATSSTHGLTLQASTTFLGHQGTVALATDLTSIHKPGSGSGGGSGLVVTVIVVAVLVVGLGLLIVVRRRQPGQALAVAQGEHVPDPGPERPPA